MDGCTALKAEVKDLLVTNLMLPMAAVDIADHQPLFGPGGLGLDSVDALQLVVALDKRYGLKIPDPATAQQILQSVNSIAAALATLAASPAAPPPPPPLTP